MKAHKGVKRGRFKRMLGRREGRFKAAKRSCDYEAKSMSDEIFDEAWLKSPGKVFTARKKRGSLG